MPESYDIHALPVLFHVPTMCYQTLNISYDWWFLYYLHATFPILFPTFLSCHYTFPRIFVLAIHTPSFAGVAPKIFILHVVLTFFFVPLSYPSRFYHMFVFFFCVASYISITSIQTFFLDLVACLLCFLLPFPVLLHTVQIQIWQLNFEFIDIFNGKCNIQYRINL